MTPSSPAVGAGEPADRPTCAWWRDVAAIGALGGATLAYFWRVLPDRALIPWDVLRTTPPWRAPGPVNNPLLSDPVRLYAPWRTLLHQSLQHGRLPYWDPYVFAGTPFLANSQAAIFYPPNLLYGIASVDFATTVLLLAHLWFAVAGMYLLARFGGLRLGIQASLLAAVGFGFSGFAMVWFEFPTFIAVYAWLPWSVLALWRLLDRPSALNGAALPLTVGMAALGGQVQIFQYQLLALGLILLLLCLHRARTNLMTAIRRFTLGAVGLGAGLLLAMVQLLPTLEAGPLIVRGREPLEGLIASAFPIRLLPLVALPRAYGSSQLGDWFVPGNENEYVAFCGVICLLLAPLALVRWRSSFVQAILAVEALSWGIALGTPLYTALYFAVPSMNQVRAIGRATALHTFALPLLAAVGLEVLVSLAHAPGTRRVAAAYLAATVLVLVGLLLVDRHIAHGELPAIKMDRQYVTLLVPTGVALLVLVFGVLRSSRLPILLAALPPLLLAESYLAYGNYNTADPGPPTIEQPSAVTTFLQENHDRYVAFRTDEITGNTAIAYRLSTIDGSDSFILRDFADYFNLIEAHELDLHLNAAGPLTNRDSLRSPLLTNLGVSSLVTDRPPEDVGALISRPPGSPGTVPISKFQSGPDRVYQLPSAEPLLRPLSCLQKESNERAVVSDMIASDKAVSDVGFTSSSVPAAVACPAKIMEERAWGVQRGQISGGAIDMWGTGKVASNLPMEGPLLFAESYYPGWKVDIDGRPASLLRIDHALMGVVVPAGHHTTTFSYHPTDLGRGLAISGATLAAICVVVVASEARRRAKNGAGVGASVATTERGGASA